MTGGRAALLVLLLAPACTGAIGGDDSSDARPDADPTRPDADPARPDAMTSCPELAERITITTIDVSPDQVQVGSAGGFSQNRPIILSPLADGRAKVAWSDGSQLHITSLNADMTRAGADITVPGSEVRGFVAHDDGGALLLRRDDVMALQRVDAAGATDFDIAFVGDNAHDQVGDKWVDSWTHEGRLAWSGSGYAAYFGHTQLWDSGNHQGDYLGMVSASGASTSGGWGWGCSHSLDVRLAHNGATWGPVCLSDCYPGKGIYFNHNFKISDEPTGNCSGGSAARLGGLVPGTGGFWLSFASPEGRASTDVGLVFVSDAGSPGAPVYLTDSAAVDEASPQLAAYGADFLAAWDAGGTPQLAVVGSDGSFKAGPISTTAQFADRDDFVNFANGDVGWAFSWGSSTELKIVRVVYCE